MHNDQIIFFDGVCNLCNGFIDFLLKVDRQKKYKVASLQGQTAKELLPAIYHNELSTVVFLKNGMIYTKANAVILILSELGWAWNIVKVFNFLPFKNYFYDFISRARYRFFGKKENCRLPTEEEKARFLP